MIANLSDVLVEGSLSVFEIMLQMKLESKESFLSEQKEWLPEVTAMVGLSGDYTGILAMHCTMDVARTITRRMTGDKVEGEEEMAITDAIGEVVNMIAGNLKSKLPSEDIHLSLSTPSVVIGSDYKVESSSTIPSMIFPFSWESEDIYLELILNPN